jgi:DNA-binding response OmpR family regulator
VMISDPHPAVRRMLVRMVTRLGYEPIVINDADAHPTPAQLRSVDALLVELASPTALALARTARAANPALAIIGEEAVAPGQEGVWSKATAPADYLAKPFTSEQLDIALERLFEPIHPSR